jgi:hypothetical protein
MNVHKDARLTPRGRALMTSCNEKQGWTVKGAATASGVSARTAHQWLARHRRGGERRLHDRNSAGRHGDPALREPARHHRLLAARPRLAGPSRRHRRARHDRQRLGLPVAAHRRCPWPRWAAPWGHAALHAQDRRQGRRLHPCKPIRDVRFVLEQFDALSPLDEHLAP